MAELPCGADCRAALRRDDLPIRWGSCLEIGVRARMGPVIPTDEETSRGAFVPEVAPPPLLECCDLIKRYGARWRSIALLSACPPATSWAARPERLRQDHATEDDRRRGSSPQRSDIRRAGYEVGPESKALVSYLPERPHSPALCACAR